MLNLQRVTTDNPHYSTIIEVINKHGYCIMNIGSHSISFGGGDSTQSIHLYAVAGATYYIR
jgi:hypothetical protein